MKNGSSTVHRVLKSPTISIKDFPSFGDTFLDTHIFQSQMLFPEYVFGSFLH